jgi:polyisoprenoid-binding protein YceI
MSRPVVIGTVIAAFILGAMVGVVVYIWTVGGSGEPSEPISAPTLSLDATDNALDTVGAELAHVQADVASLGTDIAALSGMIADGNAALATEIAQVNAQVGDMRVEQMPTAVLLVITPTPQPTQPPAPTQEPTAIPVSRTLYRIAPEQSEVRFILDEDLHGAPTTVVGSTDQVAADIIVDLAHPGDSQVGTIRINARTLQTDNDFRNRAIRAEILESARDEYEFIAFVPTSLSGLPARAAIGDTVTFQITGNLTIRNITQPVTFEATVNLVSETQIEGSASGTVLRSDFDLQIPSVPGVANVTDAVTLEIDFVALQVEE